jgi:hypothetical protein
MVAKDGPYFPSSSQAGHSWVFAQKDGSLLCTGPGSPYGDKMNPLRSGLLGILSAMYILYQAETYSQFPIGTVEVLCDSTKALDLTLWRRRPDVGIATKAEHDIIMEIHAFRQQIRSKIKTTWIKGHPKSDKLPPKRVCMLKHIILHMNMQKSPPSVCQLTTTN